jgi:predicted permease
MLSYPTFRELSEYDTGLSDFGGLSLFTGSLSSGPDAEPDRVAGLAVSANYFRILGTRPHLGRFFAPEEDVSPNASPVAVLSFRQWLRRFGGDSAVVGRTVNINRTSFTVIGIAEEGFQGHVTGYDFGVWVPMAMGEAVSILKLDSRSQSEVAGIGRMAPNASFSQVAAAFAVATERQREQHPDAFETASLVVSPYGGMIEFARKPVTLFVVLLFAIASIVLLIACVNVAGMLLSRGSARSREIAVRLAVGAGRGRIVRQLLTESLLLFLLGGGLGIVFTLWATQALGSLRPPVPIPMFLDFSPDLRVLVFTVVVGFLTGMLFGLAPALQVTKSDLVSSLRDDSGNGGRRRSRLRSSFVVAQVTGSVVLLVVAGVFLRALSQADGVELGFESENVHVYSVDVSLHNYSNEEGTAFFQTLRERASALPGVESAAVAWVLPLGFEYIGTAFAVPGREATGSDEYVSAALNAVTPEYFETLRIGFVAGRNFDAGDRAGTGRVAVLNETAAELLWPDENPIGKLLPEGDISHEVIGVVRDGKYRTVGEQPRPMVYWSRSQRHASSGSLVIRTLEGRADIAREVAEISRSLDPHLPAQTNAPYAQVIGLSLLPNRAAAATAAAFGIVGAILASVGLYGVLSYSVSLRFREIGIRIALGADGRSIRRVVLGEGLKLVALGLCVGLPLAFCAAVLVRSMLYGLSPADPLTFGVIVGLFMVVGLVASYVPARRATLTDPVVALKCD